MCLKDGEGRTEINLVCHLETSTGDPDMGRRVQCSAVSLGAFTVPLRQWETNRMFQVFFMGGKVRG